MSEEKKEPAKGEEEGDAEKELFEMQIRQLKEEVDECEARLQKERECLREVRSALESQVESERSCVSYLKRVVRFEKDRRLDVQEKLQTLRDQTELVERRALGKLADSERSGEAAKSQFLQQKLELEGKLSLLEELRLKRNSQLVHLKKVEQALEQKMSALREKSREEDMRQVDSLLKSREEFMDKCRQIRREWREAFRLRMSVHAKKQLEENVRLREIGRRATEKLLQVQDRNRELKMLQKSLELEEEIQTSAEEDAAKRKVSQEKRLRELEAKKPEKAIEGDIKGTVEETLKWIAEGEARECRLRDRSEDWMAIFKDQATCKRSLEEELERNADMNGQLMSTLLRAGKVFESRCVQLDLNTWDFDSMQQIRFLLDWVPHDV